MKEPENDFNRIFNSEQQARKDAFMESISNTISWRREYEERTTTAPDYLDVKPWDEQYDTISAFLAQSREELPVSDYEVPTATQNAGHPRTVAAAYDRRQHKLTLLFPDGTHYNYYKVPPEVWEDFKSMSTKGAFIKSYLDDAYPRGVAQTSTGTSHINVDNMVKQYRVRQINNAVRNNAGPTLRSAKYKPLGYRRKRRGL